MTEWTLLFYTNGNNELEPEMWQAKLAAEQSGSSSSVVAVMQIGREDRQLARIFRPLDTIPDAGEQWSGVRRYYIRKNGSDLVADLGSLNLANPWNLYDFIKWGMENYPARHYMLVLGGHALQFAGLMTDYSQDTPYIMGIPEMVKAINLVKEDSGNNIDILVLDACFMNYLEVIYEIGQGEDHAVLNVVTFIEGGPLAGLPFDRLIEIVEQNIDQNASEVAKRIVDGLPFDLVALGIDHERLRAIKKAVHDLAFCSLHHDAGEDARKLDPQFISSELESVVLNYKNISGKKRFAIVIAAEMVDALADYYCRLAFSRDNCWTRLLTGQFEYLDFTSAREMAPLSLPLEVLYFYIAVMNRSLDQQRLEMVLKDVLANKNWKFDFQASLCNFTQPTAPRD
jgi:hypothetical protein